MNDPSRSAGPAVVNSDLKSVHTSLVRLVEKLNASIDDAKNSAEVRLITDEIADVTARVNAIGRQLLTQQTEDIARSSKAVLDVVPQVEAAIEKLDDMQSFVEGVTTFLRVVDKVIGMAKLVV